MSTEFQFELRLVHYWYRLAGEVRFIWILQPALSVVPLRCALIIKMCSDDCEQVAASDILKS